MVTLVAYLKTRPGKAEETKEVLLGLIGPTRKEAGCIDYHLHVSNDDPGIFMFYENWRAQQDLDEHLKMPYLESLFAKMDELLSEPVDIKLYTMLSERP